MSRIDDIINGVKNSGIEKKKSRVESIIENSSNGNIDTGVDDEYVNSFISDANDFFSNLGTNYKDIGYSNISSYLDDFESKSSELGKRANTIRAYLNSNKNSLDENTYKSLMDSLDIVDRNRKSVWNQLRSTAQFYSQWKSEDEYKKALEASNEELRKYNEQMNYDLDAGETKIETLKSDIERAKALIEDVKAGKVQGINKTAPFEIKLKELEESLSLETVAYNLAKRTQNAHRLSSVADPNSEYYDSEFDKYSQKGNELDEMPNAWEKLWGATWNDVANLRNGGLEAYEEAANNAGGAKNNLLDALSYKAAKYMKDDEFKVYNYYYAKDEENGTDTATEYLKSIEQTLNSRQAEKKFESLEGHTFLELVFGVEAGLDQFASGIESLFSNEDYIPPSAIQMASGMVREDLADSGFKLPEWLGGASIGQAGYDAITTTANMMPSILTSAVVSTFATPVVGSAVGSTLLGASAKGNAYAEMLNLGYSKEQASLYSTLVGVSEAGLQYLLGGVGSLGGKASGNIIAKAVSKVDNAFAKVAIRLGGSMASEGLEEGLQEVLDPWFKTIATDVDWEAANVGDVLYASLLGALSSLGLEGGGTIISEASNNINAKKMYGANAQDYINEALEIGGDELTSLAEKYQKVLDKGKKLSGSQLNRLVGTIEQTLTKSDTAKIKTAIETRLTELGETGDVSKLADILTKQTSGESISFTERGILNASEYGQRVANELSTENIESGGFSSAWAERIGTDRINRVAYNKGLDEDISESPSPATEDSTQEAETDFVTENPTEEEIATESEFSVAESGKTTYADNEVKIAGVASVENGEIMLRLDNGEEVNARDIEFSNKEEALLYEAVADMDIDTANDFVQGFNKMKNAPLTTPQSVSDYMAGFNEARTYGKLGIPFEAMARDGKYSNSLFAEQKKIAYNRGKIEGVNKAKADQDARTSRVTQTKTDVKVKTPKVYKGETHIKDIKSHKAYKSLSKEQLAGIDGMVALYKALGIDVYFFESPTDAKGKRLGKNGYFNPKDGSVHIDLYAGFDGKGTILFTAGHELTHYIREKLPTKFKAFADILFERLEAKGVSVAGLIAQKQKDLKKNNRITPNMTEDQVYDLAYEEVVADACEAVLADGEAFVEIAERVKAKDKGLWQTIKDFFTNLVAKIKAAYAQFSPDSVEGRHLAEMLETTDELRKMWSEMLVEASTVDSLTEIDADSQSVAPMLSERTWTASEYVTEREETAKKISKALGVDIETAYKYIDDINGVARLIADDRVRLDYEPNLDDKATVLKPNSEYKYTVDMSTLCAKRLLFTGTFDAIQRALPNMVFDSEDIVSLREMMQKRGYEVACGICYVESTRREIGRITQDFIESYKEAQKTGKPITRINSEGKKVDLKKTKDQKETTADKSTDKFFAEKDYTPTLADLNTTDIDLVKKEHPLVYEAYLNFMNARGQAKPKLLETRAEYKGEILKHFKYKSAVDSRNNAGGLRLQSFSDFEVPHLIDMMQIVMDMSRVGLKSQAYTKVPAFAEVFGDTGVKINLSLIAKGSGLDSNGNLIFDDVEGINHKEAFRLREQYSKNVGTILVGKTDAHIIAAMADSRIDYIIPFHKSSWKESLYDALGLTGYADYTEFQNEKPIDKDRKIKNYDPSEYWDFSKTGDENAQIYLEKCREDGRIPKFPQFQGYPGYWKLLIDFKMYDNNGVGSPQEVVKPVFNTEASERILGEYKGGHKTFPVAKDVVDDFVKEHEDKVKHSDRDSLGNVLSKEQQEFFKDSKVRDADGNLLVLYHGTTKGGFTIFDPAYSDDHRSLFFTSSKKTARSYGITDNIFGDKDFEARTPIKTVDDAKAYFDSIKWEVVEFKNGKGKKGNTEVLHWNKKIKYSLQNHQGHPIGNFTTEQELIDYAERSAQEADGRKVVTGLYEVYANLKNPLIVDAKGHRWDQIDFTPSEIESVVQREKENFHKISEKIKQLKAYAKERGISLNEAMSRDTEYARLYDEGIEIEEEYNAFMDEYGLTIDLNTRDISKYAQLRGYDGVIFKNIYDVGQYDIFGDTGAAEYIIVAFDSEQVKSTSNKTPTSDPDILYSFRGTNKDGIEVYETSEEIKKLPIKERQRAFLDIMANEYRGRTAKFIRNGHAYYASFDYRDINKNIYGDKRSDKKGWKAKINVGADGNIFELVENAKYDGSRTESGKKNSAHSGVRYWDYFIKTVQIDNIVFDLLANVRKTSDGEFVYSIQLNENKKIEASPSLGSPNGVLNRMLNASDKMIPQKPNSVKGETEKILNSDRDSSYMDAVNRGDLETAQKMVDKVASEAGYIRLFYHGTKSGDFTVFKTHGKPMWIAVNKEYAEKYSKDKNPTIYKEDEKVMPLYAKMENTLDITSVSTHQFAFDDYDHSDPSSELKRLADVVGEDISVLAKIGRRNSVTYLYQLVNTKDFADIAREKGYDTIKEIEFGNTTYGVLNPSQLKSAYVVTYDKKGKVIPISERFNAENNDIRYSDRESQDARREQAVEQFGTTASFRNAGFIHPDGKMLDLSMKNSQQSILTVSHNQIEAVYDDVKGKDAVARYINEGNVRIIESAPGIQFAEDIEPTPEQYEKIAILVKNSRSKQALYVDITKPDGKNVASLKYPRAEIDPDIILYDLQRYYQRGIIPTPGMYSDRGSESMSNRSLLANALESVAQNEIERNKLNEYKSKIALIESEQAKLNTIREQANELRFKKGRTADETKRLNALDFEANQITNRINTYDRQLLNLESTKALKDVLQREKKAAYKRAEQKGKEALARQRERDAKTQRELMTRYQESRQKGVENRHKTVMRHKIKSVVSELNTLLLHGTKERNVKLGLQVAVASALEAVNMDTVAADERIAKLREELMKAKTPEKIQEISRKIDNIQLQGDNMASRLEELRKAYADIKNSTEDIPVYYKIEATLIADKVESVMNEVGNTPLRNMSLSQLESVYDLYKMVLTTVRNANSVFKQGKLEDLHKNTSEIMTELSTIPKLKEERTKAGEWIKQQSWNEMIPVYAFERIGSKALTNFYWEIVRGQNTFARDAEEAKNFASSARQKYGYKNWDMNKVYEFPMADGRTFRLTLKHMMSIYAYSKRNQALEHMKKGGFFFNDKETFRKKGGVLTLIKSNEEGYRIDDAMFDSIKAVMESEAKGSIQYVDEMQEYLTNMGEKGNEVSRVLWGIDIFKEKVYFPLKSSADFTFQANQPVQESSLKNDGMTKETKPGASNPIVLEAFDEVWAKHVNRMSQYHAFVLPIENLNKILNYGSWIGTTPMGMKTMLRERYGDAVNEYLSTFIKDLNGATVIGGASNPFISMVSKFKKTAVAASASVIVQQPTAILRAMAVIDAKYFVGKPNMNRLSAKWAEIKKYAPVAIIKEIGGFDAGAGRQITSWLNEDTLTGVDKVMNKVDDITMKGAALGDEIGWSFIWEAVKREVKATTDLKFGSEEFMQKVGERFTEVIVLTQVYDSTLSRSGFMRSKHDSVKMLTSFMGEPTVSFNMLFTAVTQAIKKKMPKAKAVRIIGAVYASVVMASIASSLVYGLRDDDEDESYLEKFGEAFGDKLLDDINPLNMLPAVRDVISILDGWDVNRTDMEIFADLIDAFKSLDSENKSAWRKVEDFAGAFGALFGVPVKNALRTGREAYNLYRNVFDDIKASGFGDAFIRGITGEKKDKSEALYDAIVNGDEARLKVYRDAYDDAKSYESAVKSALRDNYLDNALSHSKAMDMLVTHGGMDSNEAYWELNKWDYIVANGSDDGYSKYNGFYEAVRTGKNLKAVIKEYTSHGVTNKTLASQITTYYKPLYISMSKSERASIKGYLLNAYSLLGYDRNEKSKDIDKWLEG